jgi:hypothetical protein
VCKKTLCWLLLNAPGDHIQVSLCDSDFDTLLKIGEDGSFLTCNDDFCGLQSQLEVRRAHVRKESGGVCVSDS